MMGRALVASIACSFLLGGAIAFTSWVGWQLGLRIELGLLTFTGLIAVGLVLERAAGPARERRWSWELALSTIGLGLAALSFLLGQGPGRYPEAVERSIDLFGWTVAGGGVAAAVVAILFGALATRNSGLVPAAVGLVLASGGLLCLQPALAAAGQPTVGPLGLLVAAGAVVAYRLNRGP